MIEIIWNPPPPTILSAALNVFIFILLPWQNSTTDIKPSSLPVIHNRKDLTVDNLFYLHNKQVNTLGMQVGTPN